MGVKEVIKRLLALIPQIVTKFDISSSKDKNLVRNCADFIRSYADKYHHAKEEDILFKYFDENGYIGTWGSGEHRDR